MVAPTVGLTYETTRGTFTVLDWDATGYAVLLSRPDKRHLLAAQSDWLTWAPRRLGT
jgi:hypothetical protein